MKVEVLRFHALRFMPCAVESTERGKGLHIYSINLLDRVWTFL